MEPKVGSLKKINNIDKPLAGLRKNERTLKLLKSEMKVGVINTDSIHIKYIIRKYYEQLYAKKLNNLDEMDKLLETKNLPRLNHEKIENLNRPITSKEKKSVIKNFLTKKKS